MIHSSKSDRYDKNILLHSSLAIPQHINITYVVLNNISIVLCRHSVTDLLRVHLWWCSHFSGLNLLYRIFLKITVIRILSCRRADDYWFLDFFQLLSCQRLLTSRSSALFFALLLRFLVIGCLNDETSSTDCLKEKFILANDITDA